MKILIVEDDLNIPTLLQNIFTEESYIVETANNGEDGKYLASTSNYDVIILDWMLPVLSGIEILEYLRKQNLQTPILMLTAKGDIDDKVKGLQTGADDYLSKPFSNKELIARVEALHRRVVSGGTNIIKIKEITIDTQKKIIVKDDTVINLSAKEYELLMFLVKRDNSYVSKFMIEEQLWTNEEFTQSNVIVVTIHNLRKKIGKDFIKTFKGLGYKIEK